MIHLTCSIHSNHINSNEIIASMVLHVVLCAHWLFFIFFFALVSVWPKSLLPVQIKTTRENDNKFEIGFQHWAFFTSMRQHSSLIAVLTTYNASLSPSRTVSFRFEDFICIAHSCDRVFRYDRNIYLSFPLFVVLWHFYNFISFFDSFMLFPNLMFDDSLMSVLITWGIVHPATSRVCVYPCNTMSSTQ